VTVYVLRAGRLVDKASVSREAFVSAADLPAPMLSRFDAYASPIDDRWISSPRQRERDMARNNAFDPRDLAKDHRFARGRQIREHDHGRRTAESESTAVRWGALDPPA